MKTRIVEIYKDIYINGVLTKYMISDAGNVKNKYTGKILKPTKDKKGYLRICLTLSNSKKYTAKIHRLVAQAFIPNPDNKPTVNHKNRFNLSNDDNKLDNDVNNLEWATYQEQSDHARNTGLTPTNIFKENDNPFSKYSTDEIELVCKLLSEDNMNQREISRLTGVNFNTINRIRKGSAWAGISSKYNINSSDKLNHYDLSLKENIHKLLLEGYNSREIINNLNLPDTQASKSLIHNIKRTIKK